MSDTTTIGAVPSSGSSHWPLLARFIVAEAILARRARRRTVTLVLYEIARFGVKQAWACLFGALLLGLIIASHLFYPSDAVLARYDFLTLCAVVIQVLMLRFGLETWQEARIILLFHMVGTVMEIFKTSMGSWVYPEPSMLRISGVPLFTGFMYASVGSYIARCWRLFDFRFDRHPPVWALVVLSVAIYANFFLHHFTWDVRVFLFAACAFLFGRCWVHFRIRSVHRRMPLLLGLVLVASVIWLAENIATFGAAWAYPSQRGGWTPVSLHKLGAWLLLMVISYTMVAWNNRQPSRFPLCTGNCSEFSRTLARSAPRSASFKSESRQIEANSILPPAATSRGSLVNIYCQGRTIPGRLGSPRLILPPQQARETRHEQ